MLKQISNPEVDDAVATICAASLAVTGGCPLCRLHWLDEKAVSALSFQLKTVLSPLVYNLIESISGDNDYIQAVPNLRIHLPGQPTSVSFHSDTLFGHSPHETNYWLALTPSFDTNSLYICDDDFTKSLHLRLKSGYSLEKFETAAKQTAVPIVTDKPALFSFCCSQIHGSVLNDTESTRVSFDIRTIPANAPQGVKRRGSYFRKKGLLARTANRPVEMLLNEVSVPTIASLDVSTPVYLQRQVMQKFYPFPPKTELVEFYGLLHAPQLEDCMNKGPCIAYTIRQLKKVPEKITHPFGVADESMWFVEGDEKLLYQFWQECGLSY